MHAPRHFDQLERPALARLGALSPLSERAKAAIRGTAATGRAVRAGRELAEQGCPVRGASIVLAGWAYRVRRYPDGRQQLLSLLLPGELIAEGLHRHPLTAMTIMAATSVVTAAAPDEGAGDGLAEAYAACHVLERDHLFRQTARLGRLNALERTIDWALETRERLALAGLADESGFEMPLTQALLSDLLGITTVHLSRTFQVLRRDDMMVIERGRMRLIDPQRMAVLVDYQPRRL